MLVGHVRPGERREVPIEDDLPDQPHGAKHRLEGIERLGPVLSGDKRESQRGNGRPPPDLYISSSSRAQEGR
jgi:hypothetical protein